MIDPFDEDARPPARAVPFLQGYAVLPLAVVLGAIPYWAMLMLNAEYGSLYWATALILAITVGGPIRLIVLWWNQAPWRAYGVLAALLTPVALALLVLVWIVVAKPQILPR